MAAPTEPQASVVVPAYNAERTLPGCLAALAAQTIARPRYEVIVVDDGSTDRTAETAARDGADRVLRCEHRGPAAARNAGVAQAQGEIILFTDADCEPAADWLAKMLQPLDTTEVCGVKGSYRTRQREVVARLAQCEFEERYDRLERLPAIDFVDSYAAAFRADALRAVGGFDPAFPKANNEDVDLSYRLAERAYRLVFNRSAVVYHRHAAGWRAYARLKARRGYWRMLVYRLHPSKAIRDSYTPQLLKAQVLLVYAIAGALILSALRPVAAWGSAAGLALLLLSAWPFTRSVLARDRGVAVWAPLFVLVRSAAFAVGIAGGVAAMPFFHPARTPVPVRPSGGTPR